MIHVLYKENDVKNSISVTPIGNSSRIIIENYRYRNEKEREIELTPKELSDFIGILLHVQSKIKRDNGRK